MRFQASSFKARTSTQKNYSKNAQGPLAQSRSPFEPGSPRILLLPSPKDIRTTLGNLRRGLCSGPDDKITHFFPELSNIKVLLWYHAPPLCVQNPARVVHCVGNQYSLAMYWYSLYSSTTALHSQCHPQKRTVGFPHRCWTETDSGGESW